MAKSARAYTKEEMRELFLGYCKEIVRDCSSMTDKTPRQMCDEVISSMLNAFDGMADNFPCAIDLVMQPHPADKQFCVKRRENWVEEGQVINDDVMLCEMYCSQR